MFYNAITYSKHITIEVVPIRGWQNIHPSWHKNVLCSSIASLPCSEGLSAGDVDPRIALSDRVEQPRRQDCVVHPHLVLLQHGWLDHLRQRPQLAHQPRSRDQRGHIQGRGTVQCIICTAENT